VFGDPIVERTTRKNLATGDKGRDGLFGNTEPADAYKRKENLAGTLSQKVQSQGPLYHEEPAEQRRLKELYGNSQYAPIGRQYEPKTAAAQADAKTRKAAMLNSHVLTAADIPDEQ